MTRALLSDVSAEIARRHVGEASVSVVRVVTAAF